MNNKIVAAIITALVLAYGGYEWYSAEEPIYPGAPGDSWCASGWNKRIDINVNNTAGSALTDYQVFVNLSSNPINETSLRVYNSSDCTIRPHWCENETGGNCYALWINYSAIAASVWTNNTAIYYDNAAASSTSNGTNTFEFFDDFSSGTSGVWDRYGAVISNVTTCEPNVIYDTNPQILTGETHVFKMWYRYGWTTSQINYTESTDGKSWSQYSGNPVINNYICPFVFKHNSMYYFFGPQSSDMSSLHRWNSTDGVNWTDEGIVLSKGASGQWDDDKLATCTVWVENVSDWKMLYDAKQSGGAWKVGLATSSDGLNWVKEGTNPVISETGSVVGSAYSMNGSDITKYNGYYYIWLQRSPTDGLPTDINRYRSTNLTTWERSPNADTFPRFGTDEGAGTSIGQVADPALWEHNGQVYLWYAASSNGGAESGNMHIKLAISDMTFAELIATNEGNLAQAIDTNKWEGSTSGATISNNILTYQKDMDGMNTIINFDDPCISRSMTNFTSIATYLCGHGFVDRSAVLYCWFNIKNGGNKFSAYNGSAWTIVDTNPTLNEFHTYEINWESSSTTIFKDDTLMENGTITTNIPTSSLPIEVYTQTGATISHDWILVRKYASTEPSAVLGSEEDAPATAPVISNVTNGSISSTSQYIDWDVNQTAHNRVTYGYTQATEDTQTCSGTWATGYECAKAYDDNWSTYAMASASTVGYIYFNYTLPADASRPTTQWHVKDGGPVAEHNLTIPAQCWVDPLYLRATSDHTGSHDVFWHCHNGTAWIQLHNAADVRAVYEQEMLWYYWSSWDNSTASPNITLSSLTANTKYYFQAWSYNDTNDALSANSSTFNFTTAAAANYITITGGNRALFCNWSSNTTFANIAANLTNCTDFFYYNSTSQKWTFYNVNRTINANTIIHKHATIFVCFNKTTTVECNILTTETITIPSNAWYYTTLRESASKTLTEINTAITADGCTITNLYAWNSTTGAYIKTPHHIVLPNEGFAIYCSVGCSWDGGV